jgi:hypothetical protein
VQMNAQNVQADTTDKQTAAGVSIAGLQADVAKLTSTLSAQVSEANINAQVQEQQIQASSYQQIAQINASSQQAIAAQNAATQQALIASNEKVQLGEQAVQFQQVLGGQLSAIAIAQAQNNNSWW